MDRKTWNVIKEAVDQAEFVLVGIGEEFQEARGEDEKAREEKNG